MQTVSIPKKVPDFSVPCYCPLGTKNNTAPYFGYLPFLGTTRVLGIAERSHHTCHLLGKGSKGSKGFQLVEFSSDLQVSFSKFILCH